MSEPIQSISQGNYILQGTVATSAGIVGDGTTQNPIRADETVLWETNTSAASGALSESPSNFKSLKFYCIDDNNRSCVLELYDPGTNNSVGNTYSIAVPGSNSCSIRTIQCVLNGSNFDVYGQQMSLTVNKSIDWVGSLNQNEYSFATKVVGINRKAQ